MKRFKKFYIAIIFVYMLCINCFGFAFSDVLSTDMANTQSLVTVSNQNALTSTYDTFYGKNTKGPFMLTWKPIARDSDKVTVNTQPMQKGSDYDIDYIAGMIAFREPVNFGDAIFVSYKYDPTIASKMNNDLNIPLTLSIYNNEKTKLQLIGSYKQDKNINANNTGSMVFGISGDKNSGNTKLSSMFLLNSFSNNDSSFLSKAALKFDTATDIDKLKFTSSYQRIGSDFASAKDYGLQQGKELMDFGASYEANKYLSLSSSYKKTTELAGANKDNSESVAAHNIAFNKSGSPSLNVNRTEVDKHTAGSDQKTTTDVIKMDHSFDTKTSVTASHNSVLTEKGASKHKSVTDQLSLNSQLSKTLIANALLMQTDVTGVGKTDIYGMSFNNQASKNLNMRAGFTRSENEFRGSDNSETFNLSAAPSSTMQIAFDLLHRNTDAAGSELSHMIKVDSALRSDTTLELSMFGKDTEAFADELTKMAKLSTTALKNTRIQLDWQDKNTDVAGREDIGKLTVEASPDKKVKVAGMLEQRESDTNHDFNKEAKVTINPTGAIAFSGAYGEKERNGNVTSRIKEASAAIKPVKFIEVSGGYKTRANNNKDTLDTVNVTLALNPGRILQLTGSYSDNPEDSKGIVHLGKSQKIGVTSDLGRLKLKGTYSLNDDYIYNKMSDKTEVGLDLALTPNSKLNTNVVLNRYLDSSFQESSTYSLGITHNAGNSFNLYLGGNLTTYEKDRAFIEELTEYKAEARIGLKF